MEQSDRCKLQKNHAEFFEEKCETSRFTHLMTCSFFFEYELHTRFLINISYHIKKYIGCPFLSFTVAERTGRNHLEGKPSTKINYGALRVST